MSTSHPKSATGTSPASSARTPERRGATRPSQTPPAKASTRSQKKTRQAGAGDKLTTVGLKGGVSLPSQGSPDELRDAALGALGWEPLEGVTYQMNLHPDTPPWYDFTIRVYDRSIVISPVQPTHGFRHDSVMLDTEWMKKMQERRIRRKPVAA